MKYIYLAIMFLSVNTLNAQVCADPIMIMTHEDRMYEEFFDLKIKISNLEQRIEKNQKIGFGTTTMVLLNILVKQGFSQDEIQKILEDIEREFGDL